MVMTLLFLLMAQTGSLAVRRLPDGKPNLSGVYAGAAFANKSTTGVPGELNEPAVTRYRPELYRHLFRPGGEKLFYRPWTGDLRKDDPQSVCLPVGFPRVALSPYAQQIFQLPDQVVIIYEYMRFYRIIPLGAPNRPHADWNGDLTFMGDAIGWWEGDTLVVDTVGINEWTLAGNEPGRAGNDVLYHTDALHVVERFTPVDAYRINFKLTIDDPKIFTQPWSSDWKMLRQPTWKLFEFVCEENNRCEAGKCTPAEVQQ